MNVAITGGSGYIGRHLLGPLRAAGHGVVALARTPTPHADGVRWVRGDVRDPAALDALLPGADAVVHLAARVHRPAHTPDEVRECVEVNREGTRAVVQAIARHAPGALLVHVSTASVYGAAFRAAREDWECRPVTPYGRSKHEAELVIGAARQGDGLRACMLRPAVVVGAQAPGNVERLATWISRGVCPVVAGGANAKSVVLVDDLVAVMGRLIEDGAAHDGAIYNVAADPPLPVESIVRALARGLDRRPLEVPIPAWMVRAGVVGLRGVAGLGAPRAAELARTLETFAGTATLDTAALRRELAMAITPAFLAVEAQGRAHRERRGA